MSSTFAAQKLIETMRKTILIGLSAVVVCGCANRGIGPQGGPRDEIPPMEVSAVPENGSVGFTGKRIEVTFNEYLQLDNVSQHLIMSPPQQNPPEVKARGKRLLVNFVDSLHENTTYTLDFGNAVCDYTERNPLRNYTYSFSTGDVIDTMEVRGRVYEAESLNPVKGVTVGIYSDLADSAFVSAPFLRIAKTDSLGAFRIANMHAGDYRLYAVEDISRDYRLTIGEALAFDEDILTPEVRPHFHTDSLGRDSLVGYEYGPADLVLWMFREKQQRLYMQRSSRDQRQTVRVSFSASPDSLPTFRALNDSVRFHAQYSAKGDSVTLWMTDSFSIYQDSLQFEVRYRATDSLYHLQWMTDTIRALWHAPNLSAKALKAQARKEKRRRLELKSNAKTAFELNDTLRISCSTPLAQIIADSIHLYEKKDSTYKRVPFTLAPHDTLPMELTVLAKLGAGKQYELWVDSAALHDLYGAPNNPARFTLQMKTPEDYSTLKVTLTPFEPQARIQVLNAQDKVVRELPAKEEGTLFRYLRPDTYYLRLYIDANGDGEWTTGSWTAKRQPEKVYYFPTKIQTKSNWDFEEVWDYTAVEQTLSKPAELIKTSAKK